MTTRSSPTARRVGRALACFGAVALLSGFVATAVWAAPGDNNGKGNGPPAPGTVGNADDKAPPGQSQGDKNRGYECDDNQGIGKGNPAHSSTCSNGGSTGSSGGGSEITTPTTVTPTTVTPTTVAPTVTTAPVAEVLGLTESKPAPPAQPSQLAFTGSSLIVLLTLVGAGMTVTGLLLTLAGRREESFS